MCFSTRAFDDFWAYFREHRDAIAGIKSANSPAYNNLLERLQQIDSGLFIEVFTVETPRELIITAEGNQDLFDLTEAIVSRAPAVDGWKFLALKPCLGFPVKASWEGYCVNISEVVFEPLKAKASSRSGIRMFIPGLDPDRVSDAHNALLRAIDHGLGERRFAETIEQTEVHPLPEGEPRGKYIRLVDLGQFIEARERAGGPPDANGRAQSSNAAPDHRLVSFQDMANGCQLVLMDGAKVMIDGPAEVLNRAITRLGHRSLSESCRTGGPEVLFHPVWMTRDDWELIRDIVRDSNEAGVLRESAYLRGLFGLEHKAIKALPYRVYGGLVPKGENVYFSLVHPLDFHR